MSAKSITVSIIIPSWNGNQFISSCLESLLEHGVDTSEIIVIDNGSTDNTLAQVHQYTSIKLIQNQSNTGFAHAVNQGLHAAQGEVLILLNQDIVAQSGWLEPILARFEQEPSVGIIGSKLLYPDGRVQHAGGYLDSLTREGSHYIGDDPAHAIDYVTGATFAIRRACWQAVGDFDEGFHLAYYEDVDYCLQAKSVGWSVCYEPASVLIHHESQSRGNEFQLNAMLNANRLRCVLKHDPIDWIIDTFLSNERIRWAQPHSTKLLSAIAHAYLSAFIAAETIVASQQRATIQNLLLGLRRLALANVRR